MGDNIKAPSHYVDGREYEPKDVIRDWGLNFNLGSAVKYISRAGRKGDKLEDLQKAKQFLQFEIEAVEEERRCGNDFTGVFNCVKDVFNKKMKFEDVPEDLKPLVFKGVADEVLDGMVDISSDVLSDELREKIIDYAIEKLENGDLSPFDLPTYIMDHPRVADWGWSLQKILKRIHMEDSVEITFKFEKED